MLHAKELVDKLATEGSQGVARAVRMNLELGSVLSGTSFEFAPSASIVKRQIILHKHLFCSYK